MKKLIMFLVITAFVSAMAFASVGCTEAKKSSSSGAESTTTTTTKAGG